MHNRISRFTAAGDTAVPGSELVLVNLENVSATNHNGGAIHFGPDGKLYAAVGENAVPANAQSLSNCLGKMLRFNADGSIPVDNPFAGVSGACTAIWALGLRNPFTFAFQPGTGRMFINDVGSSGPSPFEEINDGLAGSNYGWPNSEGPTMLGERSPLFWYGHSGPDPMGCAIAGGAFYNPPFAVEQFPASYVGKYFFADLCGGWIRLLDPASGQSTLFAQGISLPVDLKVGPDGALYYLARGTGSVGRISTTQQQGSLGDARDFNGDGMPDILWRHTSGFIHIWFMDGGTIVGTGTPATVTSDWSIQGVDDFNGDGKADVLWRHASGFIHIWFMNGGTIVGTGTPATVTSDWSIQGVGDFNGEGKADVLWRHASGFIHIWFMDAGTIVGTGTPATVTSDWSIQGVGDFNGDGKADVLWRHASGFIHIWFMNGGTIVGTGTPATVTADWSIQGVGDFNGDGKADVLWRHASGFIHIWFMGGGTIVGTGTPATVTPDWSIQGVGDFNGDGKADVLWRHASGFIHIWFMDGGTIIATATPATVTLDWTIQ